VRIIVLNGVNLDLLGRREVEIYGEMSLSELETNLYTWASELEVSVLCRQTNHEGQYIDWCHDALDGFDAVIANPGAWSHYSWSIHDALTPFRGSLVEVHITNIDEREEWRRHSVLAGIAAHRVIGKGAQGYREALEWLVERR
jgi:3-dehydroquinate dehydratase II